MMKVNKSRRTNITWKVKFWIMPVLYLIAWGRNAYVLASPQAMTIGISAFLLMNLCIFCLLFKSQFKRVEDSVINILFIEKVVTRKAAKSFLMWLPLIVIGCWLGVIGFIVLSTIAMWLSAFVFLFSSSIDFNIISPGALSTIIGNQHSEDFYNDKQSAQFMNNESLVQTVAYENLTPLVTELPTAIAYENTDYGTNPTTGLPMLNDSYDIGGNFYGFDNN
jgi:hypothetical protein